MRPLRGRTRVEGVDGEVIVSSSVLVGGDSHDDGCVPCCLLGMSLSGTSTRPPGARTTSGPAADRPRGPIASFCAWERYAALGCATGSRPAFGGPTRVCGGDPIHSPPTL